MWSPLAPARSTVAARAAERAWSAFASASSIARCSCASYESQTVATPPPSAPAGRALVGTSGDGRRGWVPPTSGGGGAGGAASGGGGGNGGAVVRGSTRLAVQVSVVAASHSQDVDTCEKVSESVPACAAESSTVCVPPL